MASAAASPSAWPPAGRRAGVEQVEQGPAELAARPERLRRVGIGEGEPGPTAGEPTQASCQRRVGSAALGEDSLDVPRTDRPETDAGAARPDRREEPGLVVGAEDDRDPGRRLLERLEQRAPARPRSSMGGLDDRDPGAALERQQGKVGDKVADAAELGASWPPITTWPPGPSGREAMEVGVVADARPAGSRDTRGTAARPHRRPCTAGPPRGPAASVVLPTPPGPLSRIGVRRRRHGAWPRSRRAPVMAPGPGAAPSAGVRRRRACASCAASARPRPLRRVAVGRVRVDRLAGRSGVFGAAVRRCGVGRLGTRASTPASRGLGRLGGSGASARPSPWSAPAAFAGVLRVARAETSVRRFGAAGGRGVGVAGDAASATADSGTRCRGGLAARAGLEAGPRARAGPRSTPRTRASAAPVARAGVDRSGAPRSYDRSSRGAVVRPLTSG